MLVYRAVLQMQLTCRSTDTAQAAVTCERGQERISAPHRLKFVWNGPYVHLKRTCIYGPIGSQQPDNTAVKIKHQNTKAAFYIHNQNPVVVHL